MSIFPKLKTDAVAQYPAKRGLRFQNQVVRFVDGREQRYRDSAGPLRRWEILLDRLDDAEMAALEAFFLANQGRYGNFAFTDPWDGLEYPNCSLDEDTLELTQVDETRGAGILNVVENRS
jgi:hypothetical protein